MIFKIEINAEIEADSIDDAFQKIGNYYLKLSEGEDVDDLYIGGEASIRKISPE